MNFSLAKKAIGVSAAMLIAGQASAALITDWNWTLDSAWTATTPVLGGDVTGTGPIDINGTAGFSTISWGNDFEGGGQSSLVVNNPNLDSGDAGTDLFELVDMGGGVYSDTVLGTLFTHNNVVIRPPSLTAVTLSDLFSLTGAGALAPSIVTNPDFNWAFTETPNIDGECFAGDPNVATPCSDILVLLNPQPLQVSFSEGGYNYSLLVGALELGPLPAGACAEAGQAFPCIGIITEEATSSDFQFFITLTATKIAEPSVLALMGLSLLGFGFSRRQKRK